MVQWMKQLLMRQHIKSFSKVNVYNSHLTSILNTNCPIIEALNQVCNSGTAGLAALGSVSATHLAR